MSLFTHLFNYQTPIAHMPCMSYSLCWVGVCAKMKKVPPSLDWVFPGGSIVKNLPVNAGETRDVGSIPRSGRSPGNGNGSTSQYSCWKVPWTEEPGRLQSRELQRVGHNCDRACRHASLGYLEPRGIIFRRKSLKRGLKIFFLMWCY